MIVGRSGEINETAQIWKEADEEPRRHSPTLVAEEKTEPYARPGARAER